MLATLTAVSGPPGSPTRGVVLRQGWLQRDVLEKLQLLRAAEGRIHGV